MQRLIDYFDRNGFNYSRVKTRACTWASLHLLDRERGTDLSMGLIPEDVSMELRQRLIRSVQRLERGDHVAEGLRGVAGRPSAP